MTTMDVQEAKRRKLEAKMGGGPPPSFPSAMPKMPAAAVPVKPKQQAVPTPVPASDDAEANPFVCDANESVTFRLVRTAAEMQSAEEFEPEFTHQVFRDDETIFGYKGLRIEIFHSANLFKTYVRLAYDEKVKSTLNPADDVLEQLKAHFGDAMMTDEKEFVKVLEADKNARVPNDGGEIITTKPSVLENGQPAIDVIRAFQLSNADVYPWHARFEPLILFYIDGASAIDSEDDKWTLLVVTRHAINDDDEKSQIIANKSDGKWSLCAFATVYNFFQYPDSQRARLSQIVVAPPFQRQGLGASLLEATRRFAIKRELKDVTVEDPTAQLRRLRDVSDVRALTGSPTIMQAVKQAAMRAAVLKKNQPSGDALKMPKEVELEARTFLKLCAPQTKRCWEALLYIFAKKSKAPEDSPAANAFTELVVKRLKKTHVSDAQRDAGAKRVYNSEVNLFASGQNEHLGNEKAFVMTKSSKGGEGGVAPEVEEDEDKQDPAEVLAEYFHETMSNLAWLASAAKI